MAKAVFPTYELELKYAPGGGLIAGIDEAGRGPLAGPVVAAAVILPSGLAIDGLNDSKKLTAAKREYLFEVIKEKSVDYGIGIIDHEEIDKINILQATMKAAHSAVESLKNTPCHLLIDGNYSTFRHIPNTTVVKGDTISCSIAAASILAKVTRDRFMAEVANVEYPEYQFDIHKGYATRNHIILLKKYGPCTIHRKTFLRNIFPGQLGLF